MRSVISSVTTGWLAASPRRLAQPELRIVCRHYLLFTLCMWTKLGSVVHELTTSKHQRIKSSLDLFLVREHVILKQLTLLLEARHSHEIAFLSTSCRGDKAAVHDFMMRDILPAESPRPPAVCNLPQQYNVQCVMHSVLSA